MSKKSKIAAMVLATGMMASGIWGQPAMETKAETLNPTGYYTIKFDPGANDIEGQMPDQVIALGRRVKISKNLFTRKGYKFLGREVREGEGKTLDEKEKPKTENNPQIIPNPDSEKEENPKTNQEENSEKEKNPNTEQAPNPGKEKDPNTEQAPNPEKEKTPNPEIEKNPETNPNEDQDIEKVPESENNPSLEPEKDPETDPDTKREDEKGPNKAPEKNLEEKLKEQVSIYFDPTPDGFLIEHGGVLVPVGTKWSEISVPNAKYKDDSKIFKGRSPAIPSPNTEIKSNMKFTAIYEDAKIDENSFVTVTFDPTDKGEIVAGGNTTRLLKGSKWFDITYPIVESIDPDYSFLGWDKYFPLDDAVTSNVTIRALFKKKGDNTDPRKDLDNVIAVPSDQEPLDGPKKDEALEKETKINKESVSDREKSLLEKISSILNKNNLYSLAGKDLSAEKFQVRKTFILTKMR